jgi:phosphatidate phosphatase APP1
MAFWNVITRWIGKLDKIQVEPFLAVSNGQELFVKGRVISAYKQSRPRAKNNPLKNILATIRRYSVSSIPGVWVEVKVGEKIERVRTDDEGVFECFLPFHKERTVMMSVQPEDPDWNCDDSEMEIQKIEKKLGLISDIDDTILISHATAIGKKFWLSVSKNAYTRRPFPGVSEFYQKMVREKGYEMFYVSSSDWSLFDLIRDFLQFRNIPLGPILLKDKHINLKNIWKSGGGSHQHKLEKIHFLLRFFPEMKFILIGDSGQHDPEIYAEICHEYPQRVMAVFIREIHPKHSESPERREMEEELDFHFIQSTQEAISLAEKLQII